MSGDDAHTVATSTVASVLDQRVVRTVFQPLVHLVDGEVVGFEVLSRGPEGSTLEDPLVLFDAAEKVGRKEELDWVFAASAFRAVREAHPHPSMTLFVNFKPTTLTGVCPDDLADEISRAREHLRVVVEIDEQDLRNDPAGVLDAAVRARSDGWGVALDNVGATPASLALLPVMHPDVVKLDLRVLADHQDEHSAEIETAVRAYAEVSGAVILAQRVETSSDVLSARAFGAIYGQGWRYGHPGPLPSDSHTPRAPFPLLDARENTDVPTPFEVIARHRSPIPTERRFLLRISSVLERRALDSGAPTVLLACIEHGRYFTSETQARYVAFASRASFTAVMGADMPHVALADLHIVDLPPAEHLCREWNVLVVGPNYTGALVARDLGETGEDDYRRYDHIVTHDRELVIDAARSLLHWIGRGQQD
jgi:EAL domain-containing protein (putative c-di-GMP-specific phosphodiesterase class I)